MSARDNMATPSAHMSGLELISQRFHAIQLKVVVNTLTDVIVPLNHCKTQLRFCHIKVQNWSVCVLRRVPSWVRTRGEVLKPQPATDHSSGVGGAMVIENLL